MKRTNTAKLYIMAYLVAVVGVGAISVPTLPEMPPVRWVATFALTCVAIGVVIGFGLREIFISQDDGDE